MEKSMKITSANHIHAALVAKGSSCRAWALMQDYNIRTVQKYVQRYAPDQNRAPRFGTLAAGIMRELYAYIEFDPATCGGDHDE